MKTEILAALAGGAIVVGGMAFAQQRLFDDGPDYGEVVRVRPVVEEERVPRKVCEEKVVTRYVREEGNTAGGTIVGALVGGALGNQVGGGSGRRAATVAGAVAGGVIGHRIDRNNNPRRAVHDTRVACRTVEDVNEKVVAYDVTYRYRGELRQARMAQDPGDRVMLREAVVAEPVALEPIRESALEP